MSSTVADLKIKLPVLARNEGVWEGDYRRYGSDGRLMTEFKSRVVMRFRTDVPSQEMYYQTNIYRFADGKGQVIESTGWFDGQRLRFGSERDISGWAADNKTDPNGQTCLLYMSVHSATPQLAKGSICYELVQLSDCGRYRARAAQYVHDGRIIMRTMIDEEFVTSDWSQREDWSETFLDTP